MAGPAATAAAQAIGRALAARAAAKQAGGGDGAGSGLWLTLLFGAAAWLFIGLLLLVLTAVGAAVCDAGAGGQPRATGDAKRDIPAPALAAYQDAGKRFEIDWAFLAAIGGQECDHGRCAGARSPDNGFGCAGSMQIAYVRGSACSPGPGPTLWEIYGTDGDGDGRADPASLRDSIFTAARVLRRSKGAPQTGGSAADYRAAAGRYHGACVGYYASPPIHYCDEVMERAERYGFQGGRATPAGAGGFATSEFGCNEGAGALAGHLGVPGKAELAPGADRAGTPTKQVVVDFVAQMAGVLDRRLVITTGTNHSQFSSSGMESDHWRGFAADLGSVVNGFAIGGTEGTRIAAAAHRVCGASPREALVRASRPNYQRWPCRGWGVQVLWRVAGHLDHVHIGLSPVGRFARWNAFAGRADSADTRSRRDPP